MPNDSIAGVHDVAILAPEAWNLISPRARHCLEHRDVEDDPTSTVAAVPIEEMCLSHLSRLRAANLLRIPNLGRSCYCEIALAMDRYGWRFHGTRGRAESPLAIFRGSELARYTGLATRAAATRQAALVRGETMRRLRDDAGLTLSEIGKRFGVSGTAADTAIKQVRRIQDQRARHPLPRLYAH